MQITKVNSAVSTGRGPNNKSQQSFGTRFYVDFDVFKREIGPIIDALENAGLKKEKESFTDIAKRFYSDVITHTEDDRLHNDFNNGRATIGGLDIFKADSETKITKKNAMEELKDGGNNLRYELKLSGNFFDLLPKKPEGKKNFWQKLMAFNYDGVLPFNFEKTASGIAVKTAKNEEIAGNFTTYIQNNHVRDAVVEPQELVGAHEPTIYRLAWRADYEYPER